MLYTLAAAAKVSGLGASAIRAAIERGQITAIKDLFDEWQVEDSELHRLYFPVGPAVPKRDESSRAPLSGASTLEGPTERCPKELDQVMRDESDTTDREPSAVASQCLALVAEPRGPDRHESGEPQLPFSALPDHSERIAVIGNTLLWDGEIKVDGPDESIESATPRISERRVRALVGALLMLAIGWVGGFASYHFLGRSLLSVWSDSSGHSAAPFPNQIPGAEKEARDQVGGAAVTGRIGAAAAPESRARRRYSSTQGSAQTPEMRTSKAASITRQNSTEAASDGSGELSAGGVPYSTSSIPRRAPVPETRPTTIEGWTVRSVSNGTAVLEGPGGVWTAARGDTVPGLGRVDSIVLWGSRWIVATSRGLVTTP